MARTVNSRTRRDMARLLADFGHDLPKVPQPAPGMKEPRLFRHAARARITVLRAPRIGFRCVRSAFRPGTQPGLCGVSPGLAPGGCGQGEVNGRSKARLGFRHLRIPAKGTVGCHARVTRDRTRILGPSSVAGSGAVTHIGRVPMYSDGVGGD
jgi:hypothetical protein